MLTLAGTPANIGHWATSSGHTTSYHAVRPASGSPGYFLQRGLHPSYHPKGYV